MLVFFDLFTTNTHLPIIIIIFLACDRYNYSVQNFKTKNDLKNLKSLSRCRLVRQVGDYCVEFLREHTQAHSLY